MSLCAHRCGQHGQDDRPGLHGQLDRSRLGCRRRKHLRRLKQCCQNLRPLGHTVVVALFSGHFISKFVRDLATITYVGLPLQFAHQLFLGKQFVYWVEQTFFSRLIIKST